MKHTVLIIEDDPAFQVIAAAFVDDHPDLELIGIMDNSVDAAIGVTKKKPDILILDVRISGLNGLETLEAIDHHPAVIVMSGDPGFKDESLECPDVVDFIQKPIKDPDLVRMALDRCVIRCGTVYS